jgi:endogenous inhibitor of DNA gyrase (YacG/DUF329 family)
MVDLGAWFSEERSIAGPPLDPTDPAAHDDSGQGDGSKRG